MNGGEVDIRNVLIWRADEVILSSFLHQVIYSVPFNNKPTFIGLIFFFEFHTCFLYKCQQIFLFPLVPVPSEASWCLPVIKNSPGHVMSTVQSSLMVELPPLCLQTCRFSFRIFSSKFFCSLHLLEITSSSVIERKCHQTMEARGSTWY